MKTIPEKTLFERLEYAREHKPDNCNCVSFFLYLLGFDKEETYMDPSWKFYKNYILNFFEKTENPNEADIVTISNKSDVTSIFHIMVIDPRDNSFVMHRRGYRGGIFMEPFKKVFNDCKNEEHNITSTYYKMKKHA